MTRTQHEPRANMQWVRGENGATPTSTISPTTTITTTANTTTTLTTDAPPPTGEIYESTMTPTKLALHQKTSPSKPQSPYSAPNPPKTPAVTSVSSTNELSSTSAWKSSNSRPPPLQSPSPVIQNQFHYRTNNSSTLPFPSPSPSPLHNPSNVTSFLFQFIHNATIVIT